MKKALIHGTRICQFGPEFKVHEDLKWVDVADNTTTTDTYKGGKVVKYTEPILTIDEQRLQEYGSIDDQLDMMYWDKINGTENWINHITAVKEKNPKG